MKRLFLYIILLAAQLTCLAQTNPKVDSLYAYLKAKGFVKYYTLCNKGNEPLKKEFHISMPLHDDNPSPILRNGKRIPEAQERKIREGWAAERNAYNYVRETLAELMEESTISNSYEYHKNGADTIATNIIIKKIGEDTHEYLLYRYQDDSKRFNAANRMYSFSGRGTLTYSGIVDSTHTGSKDFDVKTFLKEIAPILSDKSIKRRTLLCKFDAGFDVREYTKTASSDKGFNYLFGLEASSSGENNYTIYKFTNEAKAREVLCRIMECARKHTAENPTESYFMCSDEVFEPFTPFTLFGGYSSYGKGMQRSAYANDCVEVQTEMDNNGFYILVNVFKGINCLPNDWKKIKSFINDKVVYYDDEL